MGNTLRYKVYKALTGEREYQKKWDSAESEGLHEPAAFILFMEDYLAEARKLESTKESGNNGERFEGEGSLDFVRKVTALGVACMEQHGAPERKPPRQFVTREEHGTLVSVPLEKSVVGTTEDIIQEWGHGRLTDHQAMVRVVASIQVDRREHHVEGIVDADKDIRRREVWVEYGATREERRRFLKMSYQDAKALCVLLSDLNLV